MLQSPMISSPLKQTSEVDWVQPLKDYIRHSYGDDPERYAEECNTLNRLRQDMRGAGRDSAAGRDLLYRYYGQLELLDLRFPVDENHIKIAFTWLDAFTQKPTSQYSLAYEKASIIFNISAVLSCHAANQNRFDDTGLKTAYHSFQASAGMFTYINENFLHAPSTDLSRDTVKTLISLMLAQGQEVFLEKQVADNKKVGLLAKLASQGAYLLAQATEGVQENVTRGIFEKPWLQALQIKLNYVSSLAQYYQALADDDANSHGIAIARLQIAENEGKDAVRIANAFAAATSATPSLAPDTAQSLNELTKRHLANVQERLISFNKDNDFIYHQNVPSEAALSVIPKLPAAKAIPVSELYQGQDIQRIIGPDIFQRIVPMSVTESASLYDEEKAKLVRAEAESVESANGEMAVSLDYLKLPGSLDILKGGLDQETGVDEDFQHWCHELAGHEPFGKAFEQLQSEKSIIAGILDGCSKQLDMEESVCEKMRSKYGGDWTQQPSSRLTSTLREDIQSHRRSMDEAAKSDSELFSTSKQNEADFDEMRSAGETDEADVLYQRAMVKAGAGRGKSAGGVGSPQATLLDEDYGESSTSVADQIAKVEDILKKLNLVKRDRNQVLKDLKEKVHNDDISNVLILNKKSLSSQEQQLFRGELEKFRPHQNRILQTVHKQMALLKELTKTYGDLLQDKRVRSEQAKYETFNRSRTTVLTKYKRIFHSFDDLSNGMIRAQTFYSDLRDTVESLEKNVEAFVSNRRAEGAQLLGQIEKDKANVASGQASQERDRLQGLMERMSLGSGSSPHHNKDPTPRPPTRIPDASPGPISPPSMVPHYQGYPQYSHPTNGSREPQQRESYPVNGDPQHQQPVMDHYNPMAYPYQHIPSVPPQSHYYPTGQPPPQPHPQYPMHGGQYLPQSYVPPPPPPGPPPSTSQTNYGAVPQGPYPSGPGGYAQHQPPRQNSGNPQPSGQNDPWAGLNAWK